jgi:predicted kinase
MELIILMGIPGSGKTTYYQRAYAATHLRLNKDQLGGQSARVREMLLFYAGLAGKTKMVIDAVNGNRHERSSFIVPAKAAGYKVKGVHIFVDPGIALSRNAQREGKARLHDKAVLGFIGRWQPPSLDEGFDSLWFLDEDFNVRASPDYKPKEGA